MVTDDIFVATCPRAVAALRFALDAVSPFALSVASMRVCAAL
jgi:hypothetical protein